MEVDKMTLKLIADNHFEVHVNGNYMGMMYNRSYGWEVQLNGGLWPRRPHKTMRGALNWIERNAK
jgi:hypothetical protein